MGPILIFDKSALQSLSVDESVWLDNFFLTNITPIFYVETLADLSLPNPPRSPERIISELAVKTPRGLPNMHHGRLVLGNLLGIPVEVGHGRPIVDRGITKLSPEGKIGVHFNEPPESVALQRWQKGEYYDVEKEFAQRWRQTLETINFDLAIGIVKNLIPANKKFGSLEEIKIFVDELLAKSSKEILLIAFEFLGTQDKHRISILNRWEKEGQPSFNKFAPYASYVLSVDILFYISALRSFIAKERPTNKVDLAYLYYLPFCHVFVSGDKLHERTVPLFLRNDQTFIKGSEFKKGLSKINEYYLQFKEKIAEEGVMKFATYPPLEIETPIHKLWDVYCPSWRKSASNITMKKNDSTKTDKSLLEHLKKVRSESVPIDPNTLKNMDEADHIFISNMVSVQKGSWRILPKGIENKKQENE